MPEPVRTSNHPIDSRAERILAAAFAEFTRQGFRAARLGAIARRAGVSLSTLRRYFPSKDELFREVIRTAIVQRVLGAPGSNRPHDVHTAARLLTAVLLTHAVWFASPEIRPCRRRRLRPARDRLATPPRASDNPFFVSEVTRILSAIEQGDNHAADQLLPLVYDDLRREAARYMARESPGQTLQPTALVHAAWLRLVDVEHAQRWNSRGHFFAAAAEAMRRILVEKARSKRALKRGAGQQPRDVHDIEPAAPTADDDVLALDEALQEFEKLDATKAQLVKLRYFAGLTMEEAAAALQVSPATAHRYWSYARAWLHRQMVGPDIPPAGQ